MIEEMRPNHLLCFCWAKTHPERASSPMAKNCLNGLRVKENILRDMTRMICFWRRKSANCQERKPASHSNYLSTEPWERVQRIL